MKLTLAIVALATLAQSIAAASLDRIQDATPIGIPLNNPSFELDGVNNGDAVQEDGNLGGYRPLYPPYFSRNSNEQQNQYYDKEYYSRGAQPANFESRLDRTLKTGAPGIPSDDIQVYVVNLDSQSEPESLVQLQNQPGSQLPVPPQLQAQARQIAPQSQQFARHFSSFRTQQTHSYFYNFKFPSS